jgi:sulfonate transport system permease protein
MLNSIRQVPPLAWLPLIVLWVGIGPLAKGVMIGKAVFFPVFLNTLQGIRGVSKDYVEVARIFEYNQLTLLRKVVIPAALPSIFVGLRYGAGLAWAVVIAAERKAWTGLSVDAVAGVAFDPTAICHHCHYWRSRIQR